MQLGLFLTYKKGKAPSIAKDEGKQVIYLSPEYLRNNNPPIIIPDFPSKVEVKDGDLLLLWDGSNAGEFFKAKDGVLSSTMVKFSFDEEKYNKVFLFYQLKSFETFLKSQTNGSGIPHVDKQRLLSISVNEFSDSEQKKIAEILSKADQAIAETEALIAKYKRIKTGLMQDLLTKGIDEKGNIRSEATHEFKDSPLGRIPKEWDVVKLGEIISKGNGRIQTGPFGSQLHANEYVNEGTPVIMPQNIKYNKIEIAGIAKIKQEKVNQMERHIVEKEDIIFARRGDLSKCSVINNENEGWICGTGCLLIRPPKHLINSEWLSIMYQQDLCQIQIDISATGSTMQNLNTKLLSDLLVFQLNKPEQDRIIAHINRQTIIIDKQIRSYSKLQRLKTGLMQDLLSGKVRVNHLIQETSCN